MNTKMSKDFPKVIFTEEEIANRVAEIGVQITNDFCDKQEDGIVVMCILKGAATFMCDLCKHIDLKIKTEFMCVSSYADSTQSSGRPQIVKDLDADISGKHIIIAEDIVDSGITLDFLIKHLSARGAKTITIAAFLHKHIAVRDVPVEYICFDCPDEFIVGYGLDYAQYYRNLPYVSGLGE